MWVVLAALLSGCGGPPECELEPDPGDCEATFTKYYYDPAVGECTEFTWGGGGGVAPFDSLLECQATCVN